MRSIRAAAVTLALAAAVPLSATAIASAGARAKQGRTHAGYAASAASLTADIERARLATAKYVTSLAAAKAAGYQIITRMIPDMGYHFLNPKVKGFDVRRPPILVYEHRGSRWQLGALEWIFASRPAKPPLPGARYGTFPAACHYKDGTFVPERAQSLCPPRSPQTGAGFNFWHPRLVTLHFWVWYPNPSGLYMSMNPMVSPFNGG